MKVCLSYSWSFPNGVHKHVNLLAARLEEVYASVLGLRLRTGREPVPGA